MGDNAVNSLHQVTVSNESTLTMSNGSQLHGGRSSSKLHEDEVGTLAQVVSKYVSIDTGVHSTVKSSDSLDSSHCFLSTQVLYSEDSSTSSVSPSADTATSPDARRPPRFLGSSLDPNSAVEMIFSSSTTNQNPDNLQSILPPSVASGMQQRGDWLNCSSSSSSSSCQPDMNVTTVTKNSWKSCEPPLESWSNLCELPAAWQYYTDPGMVANEMEDEFVDVTRELAMRSCEGAVASVAWQDEGCDACFFSDDWRFSAHAESSVSSMSDANSDVEYLCNDVYPILTHPLYEDPSHQLMFPVVDVMEEPMGYDILVAM